MTSKSQDSFQAKTSFEVDGQTYHYFDLSKLDKMASVSRLPFSIKILLENMLRHEDGRIVQKTDIESLANYAEAVEKGGEIPFIPARVILQDFTGVPAVVDLAVLRDAMKDFGGDVNRINPLVPVDLVIDHSVQVDHFGNASAFQKNVEIEYERNKERYTLLRWAQESFKNFTAVPPGTGIVHQVNLEYLASVVQKNEDNVLYPDTLVGTDSHTTMINGLSVLGWGVGGIEAEAVMLGQPIYMQVPRVVGMKLEGKMPEGTTATDLILTITEILRAKGVVGKFVEFYGSGLDNLSLPDRATISNMAPEYGATAGFFPIDQCTLDYLSLTGRSDEQVKLVGEYAKRQGLFRVSGQDPEFSDSITFDMSTVVSSLAGPKRPQDRIPMTKMKESFLKDLEKPVSERGFALSGEELSSSVEVEYNGEKFTLKNGSVVLGAITSCTNTSNPSVLIAAGLVAKKALEKGIKVKPWVKTSLAPGSRAVTDYLGKAQLLEPLEAQNFHLVGYGCTTCIGNSGPLPAPIDKAINDGKLVVSSVLSGNRNFEGRIHGSIQANYLASPPLVVAYSLAGRVDIDFETEALGTNSAGEDVFLRDVWPSSQEINKLVQDSILARDFKASYEDVYAGDETWRSLPITESEIYDWDAVSTYIRKPTFFDGMSPDPDPIKGIEGARVLLKLGDSVTTDHISPAGSIISHGPAGEYLQGNGVAPRDFNSYGSRRGNHEVMMRGTFANVRIKNQLVPGTEGGYSVHFPSGEKTSVYDAAMKYKEENTPLVVLAGKEYGTGSSRDWAAKGTFLLGVKMVIAQSYERIHRSNLIGMGVLPLQFKEGESAKSHGLTGEEVFDVIGLNDDLHVGAELTVRATKDGESKEFTVVTRLDTPVEVDYYRNGGILQTVLRQILKAA